MNSNGHTKITHTDKARSLADELEDLDWDEVSEVTVPNININVGDTGAYKAMTTQETKPSDPPSSKKKFTLAILDKVEPPWLRGVIVIVALGLAAYLILQGKIPSLW